MTPATASASLIGASTALPRIFRTVWRRLFLPAIVCLLGEPDLQLISDDDRCFRLTTANDWYRPKTRPIATVAQTGWLLAVLGGTDKITRLRKGWTGPNSKLGAPGFLREARIFLRVVHFAPLFRLHRKPIENSSSARHVLRLYCRLAGWRNRACLPAARAHRESATADFTSVSSAPLWFRSGLRLGENDDDGQDALSRRDRRLDHDRGQLSGGAGCAAASRRRGRGKEGVLRKNASGAFTSPRPSPRKGEGVGALRPSPRRGEEVRQPSHAGISGADAAVHR